MKNANPVSARWLAWVIVAVALSACGKGSVSHPATLAPLPPDAAEHPARYRCDVVGVTPHDRDAFTQGVAVRGGEFIESTGLNGHSTLREVEIATGKVVKSIMVPSEFFAEGLAVIGDQAYQLTWKGGRGFVYDVDTFRLERTFAYEGEGWGLATDGNLLVMSDGSSRLRFIDPKSFMVVRQVDVTQEGRPVTRLNELEWVHGEILANVWLTDEIVRIDPATGKVRGVIDCTGLLSSFDRTAQTDVLNGIAYDASTDRLFLTGKNWPKVFEVRVVSAPTPASR